MTDPLVLGVDLGLSGARAAVMDGDGRIVATGDRFDVVTRGRAGRAEQDPADWLVAVERAAVSALRDVDRTRIAGVAVTALGPAPVLVDGDLRPLAPALLFGLDTRAEPQRRRLAESLGLPDDRLTHDHAIPKLLWWQESEPSWWNDVAWVMDATGFLVSQLTGQPTMDGITLCDYVLEGATCPVRVPSGRDPHAVAGTVTDGWAERLGLGPDVPVFVGTYDAYADTAATGTLEPGDACLILGSTIIIGAVQKDVPEDLLGLVTAPHLGSGLLLGGWTASGGAALAWCRRLLGASAGHDDDLERAAAELAPGAGGLVFLPYLAGERSPVHDPAATGVLLGLTHDTTREQVYRSVVDGVVLSIRDHVERLERLGRRPDRWRAGGGGARSPILAQAVADAIRAPIEVVADVGSPVGPCRVALKGLGIAPSPEVTAVYEPDERRSSRYDELYAVYAALYAALSPQMHTLSGINQNGGGTQ